MLDTVDDVGNDEDETKEEEGAWEDRIDKDGSVTCDDVNVEEERCPELVVVE